MHFSEGFLVHSLKEAQNWNINETLDWWRGFTEPEEARALSEPSCLKKTLCVSHLQSSPVLS